MTGDPFDRLHVLADDPGAVPDPRFVTRLRARVEAALTQIPDDLPVVDLPERSTTVSETTTESTSESTSALVPYICVSPAVDALAWYGDVFGAVETIRYTGDDGRIGHAEMRIEGAMLMLSDPYPELDVVSPRELGGTSCTLHLVVPDVEAVHERARVAGATVERAPEDQSYGARSMTIRDPFGHRWMVQTPIEQPGGEDAHSGYTITRPEDREADA
jgi:PhnB protein